MSAVCCCHNARIARCGKCPTCLAEDERDRAIRERDSALEQRTLALQAARKVKRDAEDATIGLRDLLERAVNHITGDAAALDMRREIAEVIYDHPDEQARETVAELRRRAETAERRVRDLEVLKEATKQSAKEIARRVRQDVRVDLVRRAEAAERQVARLGESLAHSKITAAVYERNQDRIVDLQDKIAELEQKLATAPMVAAVMAVDDVHADYGTLCGVLERARDFMLGHGVIPDDKRARLIGDVAEMLAYFQAMSTKPPAS